MAQGVRPPQLRLVFCMAIMATKQEQRRALSRREAERCRSKGNFRQHYEEPDQLPQRQTKVMAAVKRWLGLPEVSTKDKIEALKTRDKELSTKLTEQFTELETLLIKDKADALGP